MEFKAGFTAITGETGSGKSILIGALGLILGNRAETRSLRLQDKKCIVEGEFSIASLNAKDFFILNDLDYDDEVTLRREILPGGKSRAFINETPVPLQVMKEFGLRLVDIHSQHENSILGSHAFQIEVVDSFAKNETALGKYQEQFGNWELLRKELEELRSLEVKLRQDLDYMRFQYEELAKAQLDTLDSIALEEELAMLTHAEVIRAGLDQVAALLDEGEQGILTQIGLARNALGKISSHHSQLEQLHTRLESSKIELSDILGEINSLAEKIVPDERRINAINEQLSGLFQLQKKHGLTELEDLIGLRNELKSKIDTAENFDEKIQSLANRLSDTETVLQTAAKKLTASRTTAAQHVVKDTTAFFKKLGLLHARLEISVTEAAAYSAFGKDIVSMMFSANKGGSLQPVQNVASGGEIARVMLALKAAISHYSELPTLILDEIDQGISGETALQVGQVMKEVSGHMQVISITHLPQIAGKADHHFKVYKTSGEKETFTHIQELIGDDRINELAEMLSGKKISGAAVENAKELLKG